MKTIVRSSYLNTWLFDEACIRYLVCHLVLHRHMSVRLHTSLAEATGRLCELLAFLWIHIILSNGSLLHSIFHSRVLKMFSNYT